jgi:hypothetical protein
MRAIAIGIISLGLLGPAAESAMAGSSCVQAVNELQARWQVAGYPAPTKQTQASITSLDGQHHASAAEINYLRSLIRVAAQECDKGDQTASLQHVAAVRDAIETPTTATASRQTQ